MAHTKQTHFQDTKDKAIKKLIHHFGNVDIAQMYVDDFKKRTGDTGVSKHTWVIPCLAIPYISKWFGYKRLSRQS